MSPIGYRIEEKLCLDYILDLERSVIKKKKKNLTVATIRSESISVLLYASKA